MLEKIKEFFTKLITEPDNKTPCAAKLMGIGSFFSFHGLLGWDVFYNHIAFNPTGYAAGISGLFATLGVLLGLKKDTPKE